MSREIKNDFNKLIDFVRKYNLLNQIGDKEFEKYLSQIHKKYYAVLTFIMEIDSMKDDDGKVIIKDKQKNFILETVSDLGNAVFLIINGSYKPAKLILRSAIETFLKGLSIENINNIDEEKRIFKMFERILEIDFFKNNTINKQLFNELNRLYSELSKDIHTADLNHMQHISSLNYFPTISIPEIKKTVKLFNAISQTILELLALKYNTEFHKMHHTNKSIIISNIKKQYRKKIHNIE